MKLNIIGDIAGNFLTLQKLLKKMPIRHTLSLGDMIDRGPRSREVVEWFMTKGSAIRGNHEQMMLDALEGYGNSISFWLMYGGDATAKQFPNDPVKTNLPAVPSAITDFFRQLPHFIRFDGLLVTHAPLDPVLGVPVTEDKLTKIERNQLLWYRENPVRREGLMQIYGHNGRFTGGTKVHSDEQGKFAVCIDATSRGRIAGVTWPELEVFEEEIID